MPLLKTVCKKCRESFYCSEGWNEFNESLWQKENQSYCPAEIFNQMVKRINSSLNDVLTPAEKLAMECGVLDGVRNRQGGRHVWTHLDPPLWCPHKNKHS